MKKSSSTLTAVIIGAILAMVLDSSASPTVTVTPGTTITNDFSGNLGIQVANLPAVGQQVLIQMWSDFGAKGFIGSGDYMLRGFTVNDGRAPTIGGVRYFNVPGDDDGLSNNVIQFNLALPGLDTVLGHSSGHFLIRVAATNFTSITNSFIVLQKSYPQGVSGQLTASGTGTPITNGAVVLAPQNSNPISSTNTASNGFFALAAPAGSYQLIPVAPGFYSSFGAGQASFSANQNVTVNLQMTTGTTTISGSVSNLTKGAGVGGIFVQAQSTNGLFAGAFTDTNGSFSLSVVANNQWKVKAEEGLLVQHNMIPYQNQTNIYITGNTVVNLGFNAPNAMVYGVVQDNNGNPVIGAQIDGNDSNNIYNPQGISFPPNGAYAVGSVSGSLNVSPDGSSVSALGYSGGNGTNFSLAGNQAISNNIVLTKVNAYFTGQVKDNNGAPIPNFELVVQPYPITNSSGANSIYPMTDGGGNFSVGVAAGTYNIALECVSAQAAGYVDYSGYNFTVGTNQTNNVGALMFPISTATISGTIKDTNNVPIQGARIDATQPSGTNSYYPGCIYTDANGNYSIKVLSGTWQVTASDPGYANQTLSTSAGSSLNFTLQPGGGGGGQPTIQISPGSLSSATQGVSYSTGFNASGGMSPYSFYFQAGWLPSGLSLNVTNGQVTGTPGESGSFPFTLGVIDATNGFGNSNYTLQVSSGSFPAPYFTNVFATSNQTIALTLMLVPGQTYTTSKSPDAKTWKPGGSMLAVTNINNFVDNKHPFTNNPQYFYKAQIGRIFSSSFYFIFFGTQIGTAPAKGGTGSITFPVSIGAYGPVLNVEEDPSFPQPSAVTFTGPSGNTLNNAPATLNNFFVNNEQASYEPPMVNNLNALAGVWTFGYHGTNISITVPDPQPLNHIVIAVPTLTISGANLQSVSWSYFDGSGNALAQPPSFMTQFQVQIESPTNGRIYNSPQLSPSTTQHTLSQTIAVSNISIIFMTYSDTLGNNYVFSYSVQ